LPFELAEGLLFGHRRGAYTGALDAAAGLVEAAHGGTLFLDELESLPAGAQVKLLRVLEFGEVRRLGEAGKRSVDFRIIATAKEDLHARISSNRFRLDLYQRIAGIVIELPRLADRAGDVKMLAEYFASHHGRSLAEGTEGVLKNYAWPGNVRELRSAVCRAVHLSNGAGITSAALAEAIALGTPPRRHSCNRDAGGSETPTGNELRRVVAALEENGWHAGRAATALGIGRTTLFRRLKEYGVSLKGSNAEYREYHEGTVPVELEAAWPQPGPGS
jgi:DNA-binding NtrC family response regulator